MAAAWNIQELDVIRWGEARGILKNSTAMAQAIKTLEEVTELISALHRQDAAEVRDAYGDILVTLILGADLAGTTLLECLDAAYAQIKDRKGYLREDGVFIKDA